MIKYISKTVDMKDYPLVIWIDYEQEAILKTIQNRAFFKL